MQLPTPMFPLDPDHARVWRRLVSLQQRMAHTRAVLARAHRQLEVMQRALGTQPTRLLPPRP